MPNEFKLKYISGENAGSSLYFQTSNRDEAAAWADKLLMHTVVGTQSDTAAVANFIAEYSSNSGTSTPNTFSRNKSKRFFSGKESICHCNSMVLLRL